MTALSANKSPIEVVGAILRKQGFILLGLRAPHRNSFPNCWDVVGGHVENGESPADALARELHEEIGIRSPKPQPLATFIYQGAVGESVRTHLFLVDDWLGTPALQNDEHAELRWYPPMAAAKLPNLALNEYRSIFSSL